MPLSISRRTLLLSGIAALAAPALQIRPARAGSLGSLRVRRNAVLMDTNDSFFTDYGDAIAAMHEIEEKDANDARGWRNQALIHINHCPHNAAVRTDFCAWHRHYITHYEAICADLIGKPDFALAYWDWTANKRRLPAPFFDDGPLNVTYWNDPSNAQSPNWGPDEVTTIGIRAITADYGLQENPQRGGNFTAEHIKDIQSQPDFDTFQIQLEGSPHNNGHVVTGTPNGHMIDGVSSLDPCFWLHHCNVDRIWAEWQRAGNVMPAQGQTYPGQFFGIDGQPLDGPTAAKAVNWEEMGFTYDTLDQETNTQLAMQRNLPMLAEGEAFQPLSIDTTAQRRTVGQATDGLSGGAGSLLTASVPTTGLVETLFAPRRFLPTEVFAAPRVALEAGRVYARLDGVMTHGEGPNLLVNVFVNCPYLTPDLPYTDEHYAGSFSFFGTMAAHGPDGRSFIVDITKPLRAQAEDGRITGDDIEVQLVPLPSAPDTHSQATITVGSITLISA